MARLPLPFNQPPRRLLVRGVNWLGDAVMTTPALQQLRAHWPEAHITLLSPQHLVDLWGHHPSLNAVLGFELGETIWSVAGRLRSARFDAALVLPNSPRSAIETWLARIPRRIGYDMPWRHWFLTQRVAPRPDHVEMHKRSEREVKSLIGKRNSAAAGPTTVPSQAHQSFDYLHLVAALGANPMPHEPTVAITPEEIKAAAERLSELCPPQSPSRSESPIYLGFTPSAAYGPAKRWPAENFAAVIREVSRRRTGCVWVGFGGPDDAKLCEVVGRLAGREIINLAGKSSLREFMGLLACCRLLLANDSGPMHLAAALGTPVVVPFGSTSPDLTGPGLPGHSQHSLLRSDAPCAPCFRRTCPIDFRCMTGITVERVLDAVFQTLHSRTPANP
jgi:heptosyltransferase II